MIIQATLAHQRACSGSRLLAEGYSPEHVRRMIGLLLATELTRGMLDQKPFNQKRFIESLHRLPEIPPP